MNQPSTSIWLTKPEISDESAVILLDFLYELITGFENAYFDQLHRYYSTEESPEDSLTPPEPLDLDEDPF